MNQNEINIQEVREKCNLVIDYLKVETKQINEASKIQIGNALEETNNFFNELHSKRLINNDFIRKVLNVSKFGLNIFAIKVLNIRREFLDFSFYKAKKSDLKITLDEDSPIKCFFRVFDNLGSTFDNLKEVINYDDSQALFFYQGLVQLAYNDGPFWRNLLGLIERTGIKVTYSLKDREKGLRDHNRGTPQRRIENGVASILEGNIKTLQKK